MSALVAYSFFPKKTSVKTDIQETDQKPIKAYNQQLFLAA